MTRQWTTFFAAAVLVVAMAVVGTAQQESIEELRAKAEQGDAAAQTNLGFSYYSGRGVPQDYAEAARWFQLAAEHGVALAQTNLGSMYVEGQGVPQNYVEAAQWYRLAAEQGFSEALYGLGRLYRNGWGVPQNYVQAHMWYNLAGARYTGDPDLRYVLDGANKARDQVAGVMTFEDLSEAQRLAREWDEAHPR